MDIIYVNEFGEAINTKMYSGTYSYVIRSNSVIAFKYVDGNITPESYSGLLKPLNELGWYVFDNVYFIGTDDAEITFKGHDLE